MPCSRGKRSTAEGTWRFLSMHSMDWRGVATPHRTKKIFSPPCGVLFSSFSPRSPGIFRTSRFRTDRHALHDPIEPEISGVSLEDIPFPSFAVRRPHSTRRPCCERSRHMRSRGRVLWGKCTTILSCHHQKHPGHRDDDPDAPAAPSHAVAPHHCFRGGTKSFVRENTAPFRHASQRPDQSHRPRSSQKDAL